MDVLIKDRLVAALTGQLRMINFTLISGAVKKLTFFGYTTWMMQMKTQSKKYS
ncbi:hypothetical protein ACBQ84_19490 [Escherichia ruysiae]|uniref:hypothetical protein n=1 Tax=Escherichia TaxID=561 RepID=UPI00030641F1|nr:MULTISPECIES: hypothetical protein [Escherichia]MBY7618886.1 hypothetical protein [Escherichia marmotae]EFK3893530.1 hypothetical protein [Escherichia coli]MBA0991080.1 hypothetical protein [Escherichia coli]MBY7280850.1 hypothetical protein [Escherichia ruysiae]HAY5554263.1 hypothetical protein [Escherichia coli]